MSVSHSLSCPHGGFPTIRHNAIRDTTAQLLHQVCSNVSTEPTLQPLTGEQLQYRTANVEDHARLDVAASGLWGSRFERTLIDVRVFNPYAPSNQSAPRTTVYHGHEREKRRHYEERVRQVEHATFVPAVMSASGGMGKAATTLYKRVATLLAAKRGEQCSHVMAFIRCRITFSLLRSCIICLRGCRRLSSQSALAVGDTPAALAVVEARTPA